MKTVKFILGAFASMAGTQTLLFWLGATDQPLWFIATMALWAVGIYCFAGKKGGEEAR